MADPKLTQSLDSQTTTTLQELIRLLTLSEGEFVLILAVCNASALRQQLIEQVHEHQPFPVIDICLSPTTASLYQAVVEAIQQTPGQGAMVTNLESLPNLDHLLAGANQIREEFRHLAMPLVLWITDWGLQRLMRDTPDLYSWAGTVEFVAPVSAHLEFLQTLTQQVWSRVLSSRENQFLSRTDLDLAPNSPHVLELTLALAALEQQSIPLPPTLAADLAFVQGRMADQPLPACQWFEASLARWQSLAETKPELSSNGYSLTTAQERVGHLQFYLGLWWRDHAVRHRATTPESLAKAEQYFQRAVTTLEAAQAPERAAIYINYWAETLQRQERWPELETLLAKALPLHERYSDLLRQARAYGFWAEADLAKGAALAAKDHANQALTLQNQVLAAADPAEPQPLFDWERAFNQSWYLFSLAKAQAQLGDAASALATLETAKATARPDYDPDLYRNILAALGKLYFNRGDYKLAFDTDQDQAAIESRFNFRAFIGAGRIQPKQTVANPALPALSAPEGIAPEIIASGREADVQRLVQRIERDDTRFTVIYGPSGVGKSSIIEAGLVPALGQLRLRGLRVLVVLQRVYQNWPQQLNKQFDAAQQHLQGEPSAPLPEDSTGQDIAALLAKLQQGAQPQSGPQQKRTITLIFDQFEEFFFDCQETAQRREFYTFLQNCLSIPFVNVVLSLREDYLSYVLEGERLVVPLGHSGQEDLLNDILKKDNREYLGNFSCDQAREVINGLIKQTPYAPESALIDQVVADLAADLGEVRPIELQIVGAQLQADDILTLASYLALANPTATSAKTSLSAKAELVRRYLDHIVVACGPDQETIARVVLYLLTDEQNTRPLKTREDLETGLTSLGVAHTPTALTLVLEILVGARLVFAIPTQPQSQYQLVHDYLAAFVRRQQEDGLVANLRQAQEERKAAEARFNRFLKLALAGAGAALVALGGLSLFALRTAQRATQGEINALASSAQAKLAASQEIEALTEAIELGQLLKDQHGPRSPAKNQAALLALQQVVYGVQERNRLEGFGDTVYQASFSPDGELIATADSAETIKLWGRDGTLVATLPQQTDDVYAVGFSPDSQTLASAGFDGTVKLWSRQGELLQTLAGHEDWVYNVRFSPDGQTIASASEDGTVKLWRPDGSLVRTLAGHTDRVVGLDFSPDGQTLVSGSDDTTIKVWDLSGQLLQTLTGHEGRVGSVRFSPEGDLIASASDDRTVKLWSRQGDLLHTLQGHGEVVRAVAFSPDGQTLASVSDDETLRLWNREGAPLATLRGHTAAVWGVGFSPDGQTLATASRDRTVKLWALGASPKQDLVGHSNTVMAVAFSPDGQTLASSSSDTTVRLWQRDGTLKQTLTGHEGTVWEVAFSPDGQTLATASMDETVRLWGADGKAQVTLQGHFGQVLGVSFSPDGGLLASAGQDATVRLWSPTGELRQTLAGHSSAVNIVRFSPDGQTLASASSDQTVRLWSRDGELLHTLTGHEDVVYDVAFSPAGELLASASVDGTVKLWTLEGELRRTIVTGMGEARNVRFSPDGQVLAEGGDDGTIRVWTLDGELVKVLRGHEDGVQGLSFSPDGQTLASASGDRRVMLWDLAEWSLDLDTLLQRGCTHLADYLGNHPDTLQALSACHSPDLLKKAAPALVATAEALARDGEVQTATAQLRLAQRWDTSLDFDPKVRAQAIANQAKAEQQVTEGVQLLADDKVEDAQAAFAEALSLVPTLDLPGSVLADLCLYGSLSGDAAGVLAACDKMVEVDGRPMVLGRRGLARALVGDNAGAIADFQAYVDWVKQQNFSAETKEALLTTRQQWIEALKAGENSFTEADLERLRTEW